MTDIAPVLDPVAFTRYIESRYHARHRAQLPKLVALAHQVEDLHFGDENVPEGLADILERMVGEMEVHMKKEELILFAAIRKGGVPGLDQPIAVMRADHADHENDLAEIRRLTGGMALPERACRTWADLYEGLAEFVTDLEEHMQLENDLLFPQFEAPAPQHS